MTNVRSGSGWLLTIGGLIGLTAAATLTYERWKITADPGYIPSCSINPVLSCGTVMTMPQASVFGFPNSLIGIVGFTLVVAIGALTLTGVTLPRWHWVGLWIGSLLGTVFVCWLIFQSLYRIGALCPYCMAVWLVTLPIQTVAFHRVAEGRGGVVKAIDEWRWTIAAVWFAIVAVMVFVRFEDYWTSLI